MSAWGHDLWRLDRALAQWPHLTSRTAGDITCSNGLRCPGKQTVLYHIGSKFQVVLGQAPDGERQYSSVVGGVAEFYGSYSYVTGRAGRTTRRDLWFCRPCAEKYATRHRLNVAIEFVPQEASA